jgi:rfaE bifunctional protein nucleotidyltransferase chain/domain
VVTPKTTALQALSATCSEARRDGRKIVLCHGVFDLLHPGHIKHLSAAKTQGDVLVVTITPDRFVNKGPGRPVYSEEQRAAMLAALEAVDFVAINSKPTAINVIELLQPDVYAKGLEYADPGADLTGNITPEEEAVVGVGGRIFFTDEPTMSSSKLINAHLGEQDAPTARWLGKFRDQYSEADVRDWMTKIADLRVLVIGEAIIDEYVMCDALGKSSKDPVIAFRTLSLERQVGGSMAIANHCAGLGAQVTNLFRVGTQTDDQNLILASLHPNVVPEMVESGFEPTIIKRRYVDTATDARVFESYVMRDGVDDPVDVENLRGRLAAVLPKVDLVVVADYGHGLLSEQLIGDLCDSGVTLAVNTQSNAGNRGFNTISKYPRSDYVCLNGGEMGLELRRRHLTMHELVPQLHERTGATRVVVTEGAKGLVCCEGPGRLAEVPAFAPVVRDRVGAGDALFAITSMLFAVSAPMDLSGFFGNLAGAASVAQLGNRDHLVGGDIARHAVALLK